MIGDHLRRFRNVRRQYARNRVGIMNWNNFMNSHAPWPARATFAPCTRLCANNTNVVRLISCHDIDVWPVVSAMSAKAKARKKCPEGTIKLNQVSTVEAPDQCARRTEHDRRGLHVLRGGQELGWRRRRRRRLGGDLRDLAGDVRRGRRKARGIRLRVHSARFVRDASARRVRSDRYSEHLVCL